MSKEPNLPPFPKAMISRPAMSAVVREFCPCTDEQLRKIVAAVVTIGVNYRCYQKHNSDGRRMAIKREKEKLRALADAAGRLRKCISDSDRLSNVCKMEVFALPVQQRRQRKWRDFDLHNFYTALDIIESNARKLVEDKDALRSFRSAPPPGANSTSPERALIWEPFVKIWIASGRKSEFSEGGPIMRALKAIHADLGIEEPKEQTVRAFVKPRRKSKKI